jgi:hypothetical protein
MLLFESGDGERAGDFAIDDVKEECCRRKSGGVHV